MDPWPHPAGAVAGALVAILISTGAVATSAAPPDGGDLSRSPSTASSPAFFVVLYAGAAVPTGSVLKNPDGTSIPSTPARDLYRTGPQFGLAVGGSADWSYGDGSFQRLGVRYQPVSPWFDGPDNVSFYCAWGGRVDPGLLI